MRPLGKRFIPIIRELECRTLACNDYGLKSFLMSTASFAESSIRQSQAVEIHSSLLMVLAR